jgi:hypothetical protein
MNKDYAVKLLGDGYVVVPSGFNIPKLNKSLVKSIMLAPEFKQPIEPSYTYKTPKGNDKTIPMQFVGGGFSALGVASSFHNPIVRKVRERCIPKVAPILGEFLKQADAIDEPTTYNLEQIIDRLLYRIAGLKASKESWHRDESKDALPDDILFGGWINADVKETQYFSCAPKTHRLFNGTKSKGFNRMNAAELKEIGESKRTKVAIPPGHILIFIETLCHEVVSKARKTNMLRLFLGWRLTKSNIPLIGSKDKLMQKLIDQDSFPLKSGQVSPNYPKLWNVNSHKRMMAWSKALFIPELLITRKRKHEDITHIPQVSPSLKEAGLPLYKPYTGRELKFYLPRQSWKVTDPNSPGKRRKVSLF